MRKNTGLILAMLFMMCVAFAAGWLITTHNLVIECDHPKNMIYVTDMFGQEWIYDYNGSW